MAITANHSRKIFENAKKSLSTLINIFCPEKLNSKSFLIDFERRKFRPMFDNNYKFFVFSFGHKSGRPRKLQLESKKCFQQFVMACLLQ